MDLVRQLAELGTQEVTLIGGEAYLHEGWAEVARAITAAGMDFTLVTGGRGITEERADALAAAGVKAVGVSVDGFEPTHDALRGVQGAYRSAMAAIDRLRDRGLRVGVNTQISRPALHQIEPLLDHLMVEKKIAAWQVSMTVPMGRAADEPDLLLQPYQVLEVLPLVARIERKATSLGVDLSPGNDIGYFGPYEEQLRARFGGHRNACSAGSSTLGIEADGAIKGCPSLPSKDYVGGNVRDNPLAEIWERAEALRFTRDRNERELWGRCADCYYAQDCLGGCSWTAHVLFGRRGNNPYCHHRALELLAEGKRERVIRVAEASGLPFDYARFECVEEPWPSEEIEAARRLAATGEGFLS